jgi:ketosteroid isomerase-like protein
MRALLAAAVLLVSSPAPAAESPVAAEVERGVTAYNARQLAYYEDTLTPDAVYIAEDGATFVGKEAMLRLFTRIFAKDPAPQLAVSDVVTGGKGEVAWARFKWTLTTGPASRQGVSSIIFVRAGDAWQVVQIHNTPSGHAMTAHSPGASPVAPPKH